MGAGGVEMAAGGARSLTAYPRQTNAELIIEELSRQMSASSGLWRLMPSGKMLNMDATWTWTDIAPARAGGRPLPHHVRLFLLTASLASGVLLGDFLRLLGA
jgi:hypothetical protein